MQKLRPLLGCIADDFTGATDLANILVRGGMRTVQTIGVPSEDLAASLDADAIVIALKSRTAPVEQAVADSLQALRWLQGRGCQQFFLKYCSTFDSTPIGNIGPVAEALQAALATDFAIACPSFPAAGRTVYLGHLFVQQRLLNESGMEKHPLTPMRDPDLVRVLQAQSRAKVGLIAHPDVARGAVAVRERIATLRSEGVRLAISDAISDADLNTLGEACADALLVTGGSGVAQGLPANFRRSGTLRDANAALLPRIAGPAVVLSGSASLATNGQVTAWLRSGRRGFRIDPLALARGEPVVAAALDFIGGGDTALVYATSGADEVRRVQTELGAAHAGTLVEQALGQIAARLRERGTRRFVVAGGETSGAVIQALGLTALRIGAQIDPGVPETQSFGVGEPLAVVLKSGNFGTEDFFEKALHHLEGPVA
ncbi:3-oxo-tetronate kinase [Variovorax saccharolyticus]|uniref:3-oxo-tetronate kinase n=1 Tax=Variovorax saccharolyticus TaxID=3053516 RepID=UPI002576F208|nr:3-oxo-tetronate kinase [Variovorax sp. J31P216]MDM0028388.1 four-carbon acid sugar kinase family protein [Variovorax sp. J31P216]